MVRSRSRLLGALEFEFLVQGYSLNALSADSNSCRSLAVAYHSRLQWQGGITDPWWQWGNGGCAFFKFVCVKRIRLVHPYVANIRLVSTRARYSMHTVLQARTTTLASSKEQLTFQQHTWYG